MPRRAVFVSITTLLLPAFLAAQGGERLDPARDREHERRRQGRRHGWSDQRQGRVPELVLPDVRARRLEEGYPEWQRAKLPVEVG